MGVKSGDCNVTVLVPGEGSTSYGDGVSKGGLVDGKMQCDGAITPAGVAILKGVGVLSRFCDEVVLVPREVAAGYGESVTLGGLVNGKVQCHGAVAPAGVAILEGVGVLSRDYDVFVLSRKE